jgi:hypothetical protein
MNGFDQSAPKILQMRIYTGKNETPLFYGYDGEPEVYSVPDKKKVERPSFLEHLPERETAPSDIPELMLHGLMDEDSFGKLDQTGLIDPILKEMYSKIQDLNRKLTDLESMTDGNGKPHDPNELKMGTEVEKEHTDDPAVSQAIADDHLDEIPDYYTRLKQMESEGKAAMSGKDISSAIQNILDMVKGLGDDASGSDALRAIFDGVKGNCSDKQGILKMVGEAFQQP